MCLVFFFFKQKTAYEMRISDWSSDVCSSDLEMGLINAAVPADRLDSEVDAIVDDLLAAAPGGLAAAKELLARVPQLGTDEAFEWTSKVSAQLFTTDEAREGMTAFLEKRTPSFSRRRSPERSEEHTSELQSLMRISYAVFCLKKKKQLFNITQ